MVAPSPTTATTPAAGPRRTPSWFGAPGRSLFGWLHPGTAGRAVVLCPPIGDDGVRAHRPLRHLAERLAGAGTPALRFDFLGTGDSSGDEREPGRVAAWLDDVGLAIDHVRAESGAQEIYVVGLRLGATIAAEAASRRGDVAGVVLWEPYATGGAFVEHMRKLHAVHARLEGKAYAARALGAAAARDALGFELTCETARDLERLDLGRLGRPPAPRVLVVTASDGACAAREALASVGVDVEHRAAADQAFLTAIPHRSSVPRDSIEAIASWIARPARRDVGVGPARAGIAERESTSATVVERTFSYGPGGTGFGVLSVPRGRTKPGAPAIVLTNAGAVHRIGPHRLWVRLARHFAALGFATLRFDLSGLGDSPAAPEAAENLCYPPGAVGDVRAALDGLEAAGVASRFVVAGLCSGGDIAFQTALRDRRVEAVGILNPRTFLLHDRGEVATHQRSRYYERGLFDRDRWAKLLRSRVDVVRVARILAPRARDALADRARRLVAPRRTPPSLDAMRIEDVPAALRSLAERGVLTLLVTSSHDPGVEFADERCGAEMRALAAVPGFFREALDGADHTFTPLWAQERLVALLSDHLERRFGRGGTP